MSEEVGAEMPRYKCHKEVHALKISRIGWLNPDEAVIVPADEGFGQFTVDKAYMDKHQPAPGGYYVVYADGYKSFSPAGPFESGYTRV